MNLKVISGGQTRVDQAALAAAKAAGLQTGGWMPYRSNRASTIQRQKHTSGYPCHY